MRFYGGNQLLYLIFISLFFSWIFVCLEDSDKLTTAEYSQIAIQNTQTTAVIYYFWFFIVYIMQTLC